MTTALVGSTGFVGSTLLRQAPFDACYHSTDLQEIEGRRFDLVVCAGAPAAKWKANQAPEADLANLTRLMGHLGKAEVGRLLLVSTVDVYPDPVEVDEGTEIPPEAGGAYGRHRLLLERWARGRFPCTVLRLPGLFGQGLRKNAVYDLIHDNALEALQPRSVFQFYDMERLWEDAGRVLSSGLELVNLATEPVELGEVARRIFGRELPPHPSAPARYDVRTRHAALWGRTGGYLQRRDEVLERMAAFVAAERARSGR